MKKIAKIIFYSTLISLIALLYSTTSTEAQSHRAQGKIKPHRSWSETEKWVWDQVSAGKMANLKEVDGRNLDPSSADGWNSKRMISPGFLESVLFKEPWKSSIPYQGIRISGALFTEPIDLQYGTLAKPISILSSRFTEWVNLRHIRAHSDIDFNESNFVKSLLLAYTEIDRQLKLSEIKVHGLLEMNSMMVRGNLSLQHVKIFGNLQLRNTRINGQVILNGAQVYGLLSMDSTSVGRDLFMRQQSKFNAVRLPGVSVGGEFDMSTAEVSGLLEMDSITVGNHLSMGLGAKFYVVRLINAKIGTDYNLNNSEISEGLVMDSITVGGDIVMRDGRFKNARLVCADISGQLDMANAHFSGLLLMQSVNIGRELLSQGCARFTTINLSGARISGGCDFTGTTIDKSLTMDSAVLGSDFLMKDGSEVAKITFKGTIIKGDLNLNGIVINESFSMESATIDQNVILCKGRFDCLINAKLVRIGRALDISGAIALSGLDLNGARIEDELRLATPDMEPTWREGSKLILRNARITSIQDTRASWPEQLDLYGFDYQLFGRLLSSEKSILRDSDWFISWLLKDESYTPQIYEQLAVVLNRMGHEEKANDILFESKERARYLLHNQRRCSSWILQTIIRYTIGYGYGYRYLWSLYWVFGSIFISIALLKAFKQDKNIAQKGKTLEGKFYYWVALIFYVLDRMLPVLQLNTKHKGIELFAPVKYWFYIQTILGFLLLTILVGGLSGLTK